MSNLRSKSWKPKLLKKLKITVLNAKITVYPRSSDANSPGFAGSLPPKFLLPLQSRNPKLQLTKAQIAQVHEPENDPSYRHNAVLGFTTLKPVIAYSAALVVGSAVGDRFELSLARCLVWPGIAADSPDTTHLWILLLSGGAVKSVRRSRPSCCMRANANMRNPLCSNLRLSPLLCSFLMYKSIRNPYTIMETRTLVSGY